MWTFSMFEFKQKPIKWLGEMNQTLSFSSDEGNSQLVIDPKLDNVHPWRLIQLINVYSPPNSIHINLSLTRPRLEGNKWRGGGSPLYYQGWRSDSKISNMLGCGWTLSCRFCISFSCGSDPGFFFKAHELKPVFSLLWSFKEFWHWTSWTQSKTIKGWHLINKMFLSKGPLFNNILAL